MSEYRKGLIRTDNGEFIDHGNYGVDVRHPDFAGGARPHWERDATDPFQLATEFAKKYGVPLLVPGHFKVSDELDWHMLSVSGLPGTRNTYDTQLFFAGVSQRASVLAGAGCSRLVKIGPATSAANNQGNQTIRDILLRADSDTDAECVLMGSDHGFNSYDIDVKFLGYTGAGRAKGFVGFYGHMANDPAEGFYYNTLKLHAMHLGDGIKLDSAASGNGPWANEIHARVWSCVRGFTLKKGQENVIFLEVNDFLDDYAPTLDGDGEWGSYIEGPSNKIVKLSQEGDLVKPHHYFDYGTQIETWRHISRGGIQMLDTAGAVASQERHWQHFMAGQSSGNGMGVDCGQANRAANLITNGHFSVGAEDDGDANDGDVVYNDFAVVKQEATATLRVLNTGLVGTNYLTYGNAVDIRLTNGVEDNFYGIEQDLLARHVMRNLNKFREATFAVIVKVGTGTNAYKLRMRHDIDGVVTTRDFSIVDAALATKHFEAVPVEDVSDGNLGVPEGEFQILLMDPIDMGSITSAFKLSVGMVSDGTAGQQRLTVDSMILFPGAFNEYAMRALIEPGHMEALRSRSLGSVSYPMASCYLDKTISTAGGNVTINKPAGRVKIADNATSVTVTNNLVTANSIVHVTFASDPTDATTCWAVPGAGSFTVNIDADANADVHINFAVVG